MWTTNNWIKLSKIINDERRNKFTNLIVQKDGIGLNDEGLNNILTQTFVGMNEATQKLIGKDFVGNIAIGQIPVLFHFLSPKKGMKFQQILLYFWNFSKKNPFFLIFSYWLHTSAASIRRQEKGKKSTQQNNLLQFNQFCASPEMSKFDLQSLKKLSYLIF